MCSVIRVFLDEYNTFCDIPTNVDVNILNKINKKSFEFSELGIVENSNVVLTKDNAEFSVLLTFRGYAMSNLCISENLPSADLETALKEIPNCKYFIRIK